MPFKESLFLAVGVLGGLIILAALLRKLGVIKEEQSSLFAALVTEVTLPALIFRSLSAQPFQMGQLLMPAIIMATGVLSLLLAWIVGLCFKLKRPQLGAFILTSGFGSSAFLGYAVIKEVFPQNPQAFADAVLISELGVGLMIFTLGVIIARYFGARSGQGRGLLTAAAVDFFRSPIFIALTLGFLYPFLHISSDNIVMSVINQALDALGSANTLLVALTIGSMLRFRNLRSAFMLVILACLIELIIQPTIASLLARLFGLSTLGREVLILESAMPSATLAAVYCRRYGCDGELASAIVFATIIFSVFTVLGIVFLTA